MSALAGLTVGITAERRADQQARFLRSRGALVRHVPVIRTVNFAERPELARATESMIAAPPDILVIQTGQGLRWWLRAIGDQRAEDLVVALHHTEIWCRGIKATSACRKVGLQVDWQASTETTLEVKARLAATELYDLSLVVQADGNDIDWGSCTDGVASLVEVDLYGYQLPDDATPAVELIDDVISGNVGAVTFTASPAIRHLRQIAQDSDRLDALDSAFNEECLAAVVGPVCADTARTAGWANVIEPPTARLIPMLEALHDRVAG